MKDISMNDFIIIIDTREQDEYKFKSILTVRDKLNTGDYSLRGFENDITIERKSLGDFISSISHGRDRFKSELARMKDYKYKFIIVESCLDDMLQHIEINKGHKAKKVGHIKPACKSYINMHPNAIFQTIISIMLRYSVIFFFARDKKQAEEFTYSVLKKFYTLKRNNEI